MVRILEGVVVTAVRSKHRNPASVRADDHHSSGARNFRKYWNLLSPFALFASPSPHPQRHASLSESLRQPRAQAIGALGVANF